VGTLFVQWIMPGLASEAPAQKVPLALGHMKASWAVTSTADAERTAAIANDFIFRCLMDKGRN